jgi:hypothetical protein
MEVLPWCTEPVRFESCLFRSERSEQGEQTVWETVWGMRKGCQLDCEQSETVERQLRPNF